MDSIFNSTEQFKAIINDTMCIGQGIVINSQNVTFCYNNPQNTVINVSNLFDVERDIQKRLGSSVKKIFFNFKQ